MHIVALSECFCTANAVQRVQEAAFHQFCFRVSFLSNGGDFKRPFAGGPFSDFFSSTLCKALIFSSFFFLLLQNFVFVINLPFKINTAAKPHPSSILSYFGISHFLWQEENISWATQKQPIFVWSRKKRHLQLPALFTLRDAHEAAASPHSPPRNQRRNRGQPFL